MNIELATTELRETLDMLRDLTADTLTRQFRALNERMRQFYLESLGILATEATTRTKRLTKENTMYHADELASLTLKIQSMIEMTYGHAGEAFRSMTDEMQDGFLSQVAELADQAARMARAMGEERAPRLVA